MHTSLIDIHSLSYLGTFLLLTVNGAINIPSSQIIYLTAGILAAQGTLKLVPLFITGTLGNTFGNMITFILVSRYGGTIIKKILPSHESYLHSFHVRVLERGLPLLFIGKLTPSLKVLVPTVAGIARVNYVTAFFIFLFSSALWSATFLALGYYFGTHISFGEYSLVIALVGIVIALYFYNTIIKKK